ncbi:ABC transporter substrate-binding protein [Arsenicicoccus piscis]|uniref:ABC transporter substrate-binding protein n=1 Tax=Arsenicicoccus piscis TaxID=673954 RepID=A0ABQ6HJW8_9MICO|nr:ABC transporter substrate-binding protein [Arsenicicoccus piscis]MCH8628189.1 ABC transporter substrate-binding protein [Arsenicicoccus piscis]GMA18425.1 ABC transporter substrate-binding protein [Arsenicicoccus piscis]
MMRTTKGVMVVALGAVATVGLSACGGGGGGTTGNATGGTSAAAKGGNLTILELGPREHLDPQRMYLGADITFANRTYVRSLTAYSPGSDGKLVADLATDTGTMSDGGKTWTFTLADGNKWEDGKPVTCADAKYGVSRTFAQDVITGGPNYAIQFLDIPTTKDKDGNEVPVYNGPYKKAGQAEFDKAVTCEGNKITYKFKKPWTDFNMNTGALLAFAPYRQDKDQGAKSDFVPFSNGPYKISGTFDQNKGGKWVRNDQWDESKDPFRKAYPDTVTNTLGVQNEVAYPRIVADAGEDKNSYVGIQAPPSVLPQITGNPAAKSRSINVAAPYVDYIQPNMKSKVFSNEKARQAFAVATNRDAYITAYGGPSVMTPTYAMCNKELKCYKDFNPFGAPTAGDPAKAKQLLQEAGMTLPVPITVVYRSRPTADKALAGLKQSWDQAGFNVTLQGLTESYYATIQGPAMATKDAFWGGWGADWPSGSTVLPALFDGRVNISAGGSGQDYGYFNDPEVNAAIDKAYTIANEDEREKAWGDVDEMINKKAGVIPLVNQKFTFLHGSNIKNFEPATFLGSYPDTARIAVK